MRHALGRPTRLLAARLVAVAALAGFGAVAEPSAAIRDQMFDDPLFRRCVTWMMDGYRGALLQNVCMDEFELPQPSLFLCARKIRTGFTSETDREGCAIVFEEEAKKVRAGYIK